MKEGVRGKEEGEGKGKRSEEWRERREKMKR